MDTLDKHHNDYLQTKAKAAELAQTIQSNRNDYAKIAQKIADTEQELSALKTKLRSASSDIAKGTLSTDELVGMKRTSTDLENDLKTYREAAEVQREAIAILTSSQAKLRNDINFCRRKVAECLSDHVANEIDDISAAQLRNLFCILLFQKGGITAFNYSERQQEQNAIYIAFANDLCRRLFPSGNGKEVKLPDFSEASRQLDSLIDGLEMAGA